ncbi:MAG: HypC/HybG/HupF family hydrogenase formation chaperone [Thermodesulfobacteriota bacterium]
MCVGVPARVVQILDEQEAWVELEGLRRKVSLLLLPEVSEGDHVIVHAGFAIQRLDEREAIQTLLLLKELSRADEIQT